MNTTETDILIIGAGLTGLTLAHDLNRKKMDFLVIEKANRIGGVIDTYSKDGFLFELGPNTGIMGNEYVLQLFDQLEGRCNLQLAESNVNKRYILKNGRWVAMPMGLISGITTPLFSFKDKVRLLGEPFRKPGTNPHETLDQLVIRRMGQTFLDYAIDPFIGGVYAGDPAYIVPKYALPKLYNLEQKYGSFIGGSIKLHKEKRAQREKMLQKKSQGHSKTFSVKGGFKNLTEALYQSAGAEHFLLSVDETKVEMDDGKFLLTGINKEKEKIIFKANKVVVTVSANQLAQILQLPGGEDVSAISNLKYAQIIEVALGFNKWQGMKLDGFGGLIPYKEQRNILGVLFPSAIFPDRAPQGGALITVFMGGVRKPDVIKLSDDEIMKLVGKEVKDLMGLQHFDPDLCVISRHQRAIAQYGADCEARFSLVNELQTKYQGLLIAGSLRDGIGMADRIKQGFMLSNELVKGF